MSKNVIHWFRKGLRLHDNLALLEACKDAKKLYPVFILDPWFADPTKVGANRFGFLLECLQNLDVSLRALNSRLYVALGKPDEVFPSLVTRWNINTITWEKDSEPYAQSRDAVIKAFASEKGLQIIDCHGHTLYDLDTVMKKCGRTVPIAYQSYLKLLHTMPEPSRPLQPPTIAQVPTRDAGVPDSEFAVPTLESLGYDATQHTTFFRGGEKAGLERMAASLARTHWVATFEKPLTKPTSLEPDTTALSPYLKFGAVSCRSFYWGIVDAYAKEPKCTNPPVSLQGQLLWREFFYAHSYAESKFDRMEGNKLCKQIAWDFNAEYITAWRNGRTGYPWIDAAMMQLKKEGWMHHLARHAVACFLTRGDLYQSWEQGAKIFDQLLVDSDWALNNGNWLWLSASAFFYQFFRVYSPVAFAKKTDHTGEFIRKYLPQFADFPAAYIYEPWKAPIAVQKKHGIIVGETYPARIVIHEEVSKVNMERHGTAYGLNKVGAPVHPAQGSGNIGATQVGSNPADVDAGAVQSLAQPAAAGAGTYDVSHVTLPASGSSGSKRKSTATAGASGRRTKSKTMDAFLTHGHPSTPEEEDAMP